MCIVMVPSALNSFAERRLVDRSRAGRSTAGRLQAVRVLERSWPSDSPINAVLPKAEFG